MVNKMTIPFVPKLTARLTALRVRALEHPDEAGHRVHQLLRPSLSSRRFFPGPGLSLPLPRFPHQRHPVRFPGLHQRSMG